MNAYLWKVCWFGELTRWIKGDPIRKLGAGQTEIAAMFSQLETPRYNTRTDIRTLTRPYFMHY